MSARRAMAGRLRRRPRAFRRLASNALSSACEWYGAMHLHGSRSRSAQEEEQKEVDPFVDPSTIPFVPEVQTRVCARMWLGAHRFIAGMERALEHHPQRVVLFPAAPERSALVPQLQCCATGTSALRLASD